MVLGKDHVIYYFPRPGAKMKGSLPLEAEDSVHAVTNSDKSEFMFAVNTAKRTYLMYPDSQEEHNKWIEVITNAIREVCKKSNKPFGFDAAPLSASSISTPTLRSRTSSVDSGDDVMTLRSVSRKIKEDVMAAAAALAADASALERIQYSSHHLEWFSSNEVLVKLWKLWFRSFPNDHHDDDDDHDDEWSSEEEEVPKDPVQFEYGCDPDDSLAVWRGYAAAEAMMQRIVDFMYACGAGDAEFKMLAALAGIIRPETAGLWMEARSDAVLIGGYDLKMVDLDCSGEIVKMIGHAKLNDFYEKNASRVKVSSISRNFGEVEKGFVLTLRVASNQIEMLYNSFGTLMPLPLTMVKNIRLLDKSLDMDFFRVYVSDDGTFSGVDIVLPGAATGKSMLHLGKLFRADSTDNTLRIQSKGSSVRIGEWRGLEALLSL
jgi:hypothetical protein